MNKITALRDVVLNEKCLLHGSPTKIDELRPHYTDGEMAICATPFSEIAVFMAVVAACKPGSHSFVVSIKNGKCSVEFTMCKHILARLLQNDAKGYVYVLDSEGFKKRDIFEHRAYESLYCMRTLTVTKEHLPFIPIPGELHYKVLLDPLFAAVFN